MRKYTIDASLMTKANFTAWCELVDQAALRGDIALVRQTSPGVYLVYHKTRAS